MTEKRVLSIWEQVRLLDGLVGRCVMAGGAVAETTTITIDKETAEHLHHLALRLERLAPHEERIRKLVMGR